MQQILHFGENLAFAVVVFFFIYIAKLIADWRTKKIDDDYEIEEESNLAIGIRRAGLYLGISIAMIGPLSSGGQLTFFNELKAMAADGILVLFLLFTARFISDKLILKGIDNDDEAKKKNAAVGTVEFAIYIATGLILNGSFSGEGGGFLTSIVFFALGQIVLILICRIYEAVTPYSLLEEIKNQNLSAGISLGGTVLAMGIILRSSVTGNFVSWGNDLIGFGISAVSGIVLLLILKKVTDKLFLPHTNLKTEIVRDKNSAALILTESVIIAFAIILSGVV